VGVKKRNKDDDYIDGLEEQIETMKTTALENGRFMLIALNLSGNREALESEAEALIESCGFLGALGVSNSRKGAR
jgi:hypothetical protein